MTEDEMVGWHHQLNGLKTLILSKLWAIVKDGEAWRAAVMRSQSQTHLCD